MPPTLCALHYAIILLLGLSSAEAQVFKTQEAALQEAFAGADTVIRQTVFLDDAEVAALQEKSRSEFTSRVISYYSGFKDGKLLGCAFFEDQVVRTKKTIVMVVVNPDATVNYMEALAFYEPQDYLPILRWFDLFKEKNLSPELWPGRQIHAVTGATLSVRTFTLCVRRALALYEFIKEVR